MFIPSGAWCPGSHAILGWYLTFQVVRKTTQNVGMKRAFLNAPWDFIHFSMGFPHAAAQVGKKQSSLVICGLPWLVKMVTP